MGILAIISALLGLTYFLTWSISFYPQLIHNYQRRTTAGLAISYPVLNLFSFTTYTIYTGVFCFSPAIRAQYAARHPESPVPAVSPWDFAFSAHAWVIIAIGMSQFLPRLWGFQPLSDETAAADGTGTTTERRVSTTIWVMIACGLAGLGLVCGLVLGRGKEHGADPKEWAYIDIIYSFSALKIYFTFFKYTPQVIYNARRRSTAGFSIAQILLDFAGGIASVLQLFIDAQRFAHYRNIREPSDLASMAGRPGWADGVDGNIAKFWLGNMSILFDIVFMTQHYVLYPQKSQKADDASERDEEDAALGTEQQPLLGDSRGR